MASSYGFGDTVSCNNCICWSSDNRIAISTDKSVRILSLVSNTKNIEPRSIFHQSFIETQSDLLDIPEYSDENNLNLVRKLPKDIQMRFITDKVMNPYKFTQNTLPLTGYCAAQWSPPQLTKDRRCVLAVLSHDFRFTLHAQSAIFKWQKLCDLSVQRLKQARSKDSQKIKSVERYKDYKNWCYMHAVVAISWCPQLYRDKESGRQFALLATGTKSGHVVIWKISSPLESGSDCSVYTTVRPHKEYTTQIGWSRSSSTLAAGYVDGQLYTVQVDPTDLTTEPIIQPVIKEPDLLRISSILFERDLQNGKDVLLVTKEEYVLGFLLDPQQTIISSSHLIGETTLYATAMCSFGDKLVLVSYLDGSIKKLHCAIERDELKLTISNMTLDIPPVFDRPWVCQGITQSPNQVYMAFIQRPVPGYDSLELIYRTSVLIHFRSIAELGICEDTEKLIIDKFDNFKSFSAQKLDVLELYRNYLLQHCLRNWATLNSPSVLDRSNLMAYRYRLLLHYVYMLSREEPERDNPEFPPVLEKVKTSIVELTAQIQALHIQEAIRRIKTSDNSGNKSKYLAVLVNMLSFLRLNKDQLQPLDFSSTEQELVGLISQPEAEAIKTECCICSCSLICDKRQLKCENGHAFDMCCYTLEPCEGIDYCKCAVCGVVSLTPEQLKEYDWMADMIGICSLCEGSMHR